MVLQIFIGIVIYMAIGMFYYSPILFGNRWVKLLNITPSHPRYGILTLVTILTSTLLAVALQLSEAETIIDGALFGLFLGVIVALAYAKDFIFGLGTHTQKPLALYFICVGYHIIVLTIIGAVMMMFS
ncbi:DUF1761 domain-containing protein [Bacillus shivajii]|uniref:DUF1761 domain-containing protein n=1 Tax=Bacillus shivajii TaxID=1983719 RepID=UPI001CFA200D|nr:DUF1761 domain-containing protein [Bacillus shivajii]UCZ51606.1 DUF1761 domain-containing protein [Bacillus shivajii]